MQFDRLSSNGDITTTAGGGKRDSDAGKPQYDLLPWDAVDRIVWHLMLGAEKYDRHNWAKGIPALRCFQSAMRHLIAWFMGKRDEDHLAAAGCNILFLLAFEQRKRWELFHDIPNYTHDE
jgi:hypothetical protein